MRAARLRVAAHQYGILGVEKHHARLQQFFDAFQDFGQAVECRALAHIHHDGGAFHVARGADEAGKMGQKLEGKIVDAVKSQVLKGLER